MTSAREKILFGNTEIFYTIRRSGRRKTLGINVTADGEVEVVAPGKLSRDRIARMVEERGWWIFTKQEACRRIEKAVPHEWTGGESIWFSGRQVQLKFISGDVAGARLNFTAERAEIRVPKHWTGEERAAAARVALRSFYRAHLERVVPPIATRFAGLIGEGDAPVEIRVRDLGHRWGSCGKNRVLFFHWRLAAAPKSLIELVVAHEVCHLRVPDHSPKFFRLLTRILPGWENRQERLDREGARYDF